MSLPEEPRPLDDDIVLGDDPGPFRPPPGYRFEEELDGPAPRPRAEILKRGRHASKQRRSNWALLAVGASLMAIGPLPAVQTIGLYFLPLAYLTYIGLVILAFGGIGLLLGAVRSGPYRYVEEGVPVVARILALRLVPSAFHEGQATRHRFDALFEYLDPETGTPRTSETQSSDFLAGARHGLTTSYRVGDYATAVYLPHDPAKTIKLYGFLDLRPDLGLVRRDASPESSPAKGMLTAVAAIAFMSALFWNVYAFGRFSPLRIATAPVVIVGVIGAIGLGGGLLWSIRAEQVRAQRRREERNAEALARGEAIEPDLRRRRGPFGDHGPIMTVILVLAALGLGGVTFFCWAITANAVLDGSPASRRPVVVDEAIQVTHKALFREYRIKYHFPDDPATKHEFLSTPAEIDALDGPVALAEVHAGRFGWPWVQAIRPIPHRLGP